MFSLKDSNNQASLKNAIDIINNTYELDQESYNTLYKTATVLFDNKFLNRQQSQIKYKRKIDSNIFTVTLYSPAIQLNHILHKGHPLFASSPYNYVQNINTNFNLELNSLMNQFRFKLTPQDYIQINELIQRSNGQYTEKILAYSRVFNSPFDINVATVKQLGDAFRVANNF